MKNDDSSNRKLTGFFVVLVSALICSVLSLCGAFRKFDYKMYDFMLPFTKEIKADNRILLVEIDDFAIEQVGDWPWTRDIMGNALLRMKDLGAERVIFDIEYLSPASLALNLKAHERTDEIFDFEARTIAEGLASFSDEIAAGNIPLSAVGDVSRQFFSNYVMPSITSMKNATDSLIQDNDDYFSRCIQFFGNSWLTVNMQSMGLERTAEEQDYAKKRFGLNIVSDPFGFIKKGNTAIKKLEAQAAGFYNGENAQYITPAVSPIINAARGASFTNCFVDLDGTRRRIQLLENCDGAFIGQLVFAPIIDLLDVQKIQRLRSKLVLEGAKLPGSGERKNIAIPLDDTGCMMINWLHSTYLDSFGGSLGNVSENRHESFAFLNQLDTMETYIFENLNILSSLDYTSGEVYKASSGLSAAYSDILAVKKALLQSCEGFDVEGNAIGGGLNEELLAQYYQLRTEYFEGLRQFVSSSDFEDLFDYGDEAAELAEAISSLIKTYDEYEADMKQKYAGAFCLIGFTANASTDFGTTPFDRIYANLGVHANVANTILNGDFITPLAPWWGAAFALFMVALIVFLTRNQGLARKIIFGLIYVVSVIVLLFVLMIGFKLFIPPAMPITFSLMCFLGNSGFNFIRLEKDRSILRRGFDAYLAPEVVNQIVKDPSKLRLGGDSRHLTALFSDVRKFSGFTECVNKIEGEEKGAARLVAILNDYLGLLSDAIMKEGGTIDKYVGDEIVSFFGAPFESPNNAYYACVAGIKMKQAENLYNREHSEDLPLHPKTGTPFLLKSRVGLNTGDMVVGNMGTLKRLNYTVMGNNVNLASRLEGTNKEYDSWIMASESTWKDADSGEFKGRLVARQLDCVKVINVEKPVQIYSIVGLKNELTSAEIEAAEIFNQGMEWYLKGRETPELPKNSDDLKKAIDFFEKAYNCFHTVDEQDAGFISMEKKMINRCEAYLNNGLPAVWDGVFTMQTK